MTWHPKPVAPSLLTPNSGLRAMPTEPRPSKRLVNLVTRKLYGRELLEPGALGSALLKLLVGQCLGTRGSLRLERVQRTSSSHLDRRCIDGPHAQAQRMRHRILCHDLTERQPCARTATSAVGPCARFQLIKTSILPESGELQAVLPAEVCAATMICLGR